MNKMTLIVILLLVLAIALFTTKIETFAIDSINIRGIIEGLDEILYYDVLP